MRIDAIIASEAVWTDTSHKTHPIALAVAGDRIARVGHLDDVRAFAREVNGTTGAPEIRDFGDALIVPGFHDSHLHFFHSSVYGSPLATTFVGESEADCVARMKSFAVHRPEGWLLAQGWREYRWNTRTLPTKASLDAAFPDRPVALYSGDAHTLWLNSVALSHLGVTRESTPPIGGSYDRDESGDLTGIVRESAAMELMPRIMNTFSDADIASAYRGFLAQLAHNGITSVCDISLMAYPGLDFIRDDIHALLLEHDELTARIHMFPTLLASMDRFETMRTRFMGSLLQASGLKQFFDGVSSQHTAWVARPYTNARYADDCGRPTVDPAAMRTMVTAAAEKGYPVRIHTIGDAAIHEALDIFEEARHCQGPLPKGRHNCLEHMENFRPSDIARLAALDVIASVQPPHMTLDPGGPERDLGPERVPYMWPFRALLEAGTTLAFGTDAPVVDVNSMNVLYAAVTRQDPLTHEPAGGWIPEERLSMPQALRAYTLGSARACSRQHELGSLEVGKLADLTVLDRNILTDDPDDLQKTQVLATFTGGRCVFER